MYLLHMYLIDTCISRYIQAYFCVYLHHNSVGTPLAAWVGTGDFPENSATEIQIPENQQGGPGD